jgi:hypothetical protein
MGRPRKYPLDQLKEIKTLYNKTNYNRILAIQPDLKRLTKSYGIVERYLDGVEKLNKTNDHKIVVDTSKLTQLLKTTNNINLNIRIEETVKKLKVFQETTPETEVKIDELN